MTNTMRGEVVKVTPDMAAAWLEKNTLNRKLLNTRVTQYSTSMRLGLWRLTAEPIVFDRAGNLINGQHRLWAVLLSGTPQDFYIVRDADPETLLYMDQNAPRHPADNVNLKSKAGGGGDVMTRDDAAVLRQVLQGYGRKNLMLPAEVLEKVWPQYAENILAVKEACSGRTSRPTGIQLRAICARAMFTKNKERIIRFCNVMVSGEAKPGERAAIQLRDLILTDWSRGSSRPTQKGTYSKTQAALDHFLKGTHPTLLRGVEHDLWEIPQSPLVNRLKEQAKEFEQVRQRHRDKDRKKIDRSTITVGAHRLLDLIRHKAMKRVEIEQYAGMSKPALSKLLRELVVAGYVVKSKDKRPVYMTRPSQSQSLPQQPAGR